MTVDDLLAVKSVSDPQVSPDGKLVAYVVSEIDRAANKANADVWLVPTTGGEPKKLTASSPASDNHPRWSPDGRSLAFASDRSGSIPGLDLADGRRRGPPAHEVAHRRLRADLVARRGTSSPSPPRSTRTLSPEETAKKLKAKAELKTKVRTYDHLMARHWSSWVEETRSHLFVCDARTGEAKDLTPKLEVNTPPGSVRGLGGVRVLARTGQVDRVHGGAGEGSRDLDEYGHLDGFGRRAASRRT